MGPPRRAVPADLGGNGIWDPGHDGITKRRRQRHDLVAADPRDRPCQRPDHQVLKRALRAAPGRFAWRSPSAGTACCCRTAYGTVRATSQERRPSRYAACNSSAYPG